MQAASGCARAAGFLVVVSCFIGGLVARTRIDRCIKRLGTGSRELLQGQMPPG